MEIQINVKKLKSEKSEAVKLLGEFLNEILDVEATVTDELVVLKTQEDDVSKRTVKDLIKKFLRKEKLDRKLRVTTYDPTTLFINDRKYVD